MYNNFSSKKTKKVISALLASALVVTSAPITASAATKKVVGVGKTVTYKAGATVKKITVKNKKVVKATKSKKSKKNVVLKGLKAGKTTVTIKTSKKTIKLNVCVGATKITKKTLKTTMTAGTTQTVSVTATGGKGDTIKFASSNKAVLKVNKTSAKASAKGIAKMDVAAVAEGTAKLTVSSKYTGVKKSFTIKVTAAQPAPTQAPTVVSTPGITTPTATVAATNAPSAVTTPGVTAPGTTDAAGATNVPGTTDNASSETPTTTDAVASPEATTTDAPATVAPSFDPETAKEGTLTVTTNVSGASIKVISGGATVASATAGVLDTSVTTGKLTPGVYTVEVSKKGYDTYKTTVTIDGDVNITADLAEAVVLGASATVTNALVGYENTVLVNESAIITVTVKDKDGNLVPNKTVVFSMNTVDDNGGTADFEPKGQNVQVTDANGKASFVIGTTSTSAKAISEDLTGAVEFTARVLDVTDGTNPVATGCVGFAALRLGSVAVDKDTADLKNEILLPGDEASTKAGYSDRDDGIRKTHSLYGTNDVNYINTQQVSAEGKTDRAITFNVVPKIVLPRMTNTTDNASSFVQPVNETSGDYGTYVDDEFDKVIELKEDASKLQYATLIFNNIQLSPYTKLVIKSYTDVDCEDDDYIQGSLQEIGGNSEASEQSSFGYQIPLTQTANGTVKAVKVSIKSAGQVQTDKNAGYDIKEIRGVYNSSNVSGDRKTVDIETAKVSWETVTPIMSNVQPLDKDDAVTVYRITPNDNKVDGSTTSTFDYQVPVYPYTGNAVIREFADSKVVAYYLVPTVKSVDDGSKNTNVLADITLDGVKAYKATEEEAKTFLEGGITTKDNSVTVNSEKVGTTALKGTISLAGVGSDVLDDANRYVYTSVQWNPIPTKQASTSDSYIALAGQKITVKAKLIDKNGNPVTKSGQTVTYSYTDDTTGTTKSFSSGTSVDNINKIAVVKNENTDINGETQLVLSAANADVLDNLTAEYAGGSYDVVLSIGDKASTSADLYWTNADLSFTDGVNADAKTIRTDNDTATANVSNPKVSTPWMYAVKTVGTEFTSDKFEHPGELEGWNISIDGLKIKMSSDIDNKGKYDLSNNDGSVLATSEFENMDSVTAKIDSSSMTDKVTFKATKTGEKDKVFTCVGEGTPNMNARMDLSVNWKAEGNGLSIIAVEGNTIGQDTTTLYVKYTDGTGKNPKQAEVTFKSNNVGDVFTDTYTDNGSTNSDGVVKTGADGIAKITLTKTALAKASIITASVANVDQVASTTINWETAGKAFEAVGAASATDDNNNVLTNQVELTFNNAVLASSARADLFDVTYKDGSETKHVNVKSAKASGKKVILTLDTDITAGDYTVTIDKIEKDSVEYNLVDEKGEAITTGSTVNFYAGKNATFDVKYDTGKIEILNIKSSVDLVATGADASVAAVKAEFEKYFRVVIDGEVKDTTALTASNVVKTSATNYSITYANTTAAKQKVEVYFLGNQKSVWVDADATAAADALQEKDEATVGKLLKAFTNATTIAIPANKVDATTTVTFADLTSGGADADFIAVAADGKSVTVDMSDADFTDSATDKFTVTVNTTGGSSTIVKTYTIKAVVPTSGAKSYVVTCDAEDNVKADIKAVEDVLTAQHTGDITIDVDNTLPGKSSTYTTSVVKDLGTILTGGTYGHTVATLSDHKGQSATFTIAYKNAADGDTAAGTVSITKTYKLTVNDEGTKYTITVVE